MEEKPVTIRRLILAAAQGSTLDEKRARQLFADIMARRNAGQSEDKAGGGK